MPSQFFLDWLEEHHNDRIKQVLVRQLGREVFIDFCISKEQQTITPVHTRPVFYMPSVSQQRPQIGGMENKLYDIDDKIRGIVIEIDNNKNINSFRRNLQTTHLGLLEIIILNDNIGFPNDAKLLARYNLKEILKDIYHALASTSINEYTKAHLENSAETIEAILEAKLSLN